MGRLSHDRAPLLFIRVVSRSDFTDVEWGAAMVDHRGGDKLYHLVPLLSDKQPMSIRVMSTSYSFSFMISGR